MSSSRSRHGSVNLEVERLLCGRLHVRREVDANWRPPAKGRAIVASAQMAASLRVSLMPSISGRNASAPSSQALYSSGITFLYGMEVSAWPSETRPAK